MSHTVEPEHNPCIVAGVQPLLTELQEPVSVYFRGQQDAEREPLETFIHQVFEKSFGADLYEHSLALRPGRRQPRAAPH